MTSRRKFWLTAPPIQAIGEAWLIGLLVAFWLSRLVGQVTSFTLNSGALLLCGLSGIWAVLRVRLPAGSFVRQAIYEIVIGTALAAAMLALRLPVRAFGLETIWTQSSWGLMAASVLLAATGVGYITARVVLRIWLMWDGLRRRRLLWSLTHAHLLVVAVGTIIVVAGLFVAPNIAGPIDSGGPMVRLVSGFLRTIFPTIGVIVIFVGIALVVVLPPSALFSFLVARQTTRRLETLAATAKAVRGGDYHARVPVVGEDEVAHLQADFNAMADELARTLADLQVQRDTVAHLLDARREMIAGVSHELRTPVATVRAMLEADLSRHNEPSPAVRRDLEVMDGEMARLEGLIDDLFLLARADAGRLQLDCQPIDASPTVHRIVEAFAPLAWRASRVEVSADLPAGPPLACADEERLGQVLANLLRNAVHHTEPGGIVAVRLRAEPDAVILEVRDTGAGIPPTELPHIWERFYRGEHDRARGGDGVGLGLALVKELVEAMGGSVAVESTVGQGSCFAVRLPRA